MSLVDTILDHPGNAERIDQVVRQVHGLRKHRGWILADGEALDDHAWVHARSFLMDAGGSPGLRRERREGGGMTSWEVLSWLEARSSYSLVVARPTRERPSQEILEFLEHAQETQVPYVVLQVDGGPERLRFLDSEGRLRPLPALNPVYSEMIPLRLQGKRLMEGEYLLPLTVAATIPESRARLEVELLREGLGFQHPKYGFLIENPAGSEIGSGYLVLDVQPNPQGEDELVLRPEGFPEPPRVYAFEGRVPMPALVSSVNQHWRVHVLFDRTTLDVDQWPTAAASIYERKGEAAPKTGEDVSQLLTEPVAPESRSAANSSAWNLHLRQSLAAALPELDQQMPGLEIHLWWFADVPREGIERHPVLESAPVPFNPCGRCPTARLAEVLEGEQFGYCPGLDVYDAVDEALEALADAFRTDSSRGIRQAVIVVGDSPPPPQDVADPLWREIPGWPIVTNARCSPRFRKALRDLAALRVPVGWLFVRSPRSPSLTPEAGLTMGKGYAAFQSLKERVLRVLQGTEGLVTIETETEDQLAEPLRRLAALLGGDPAGVAGVDFSLDLRSGP